MHIQMLIQLSHMLALLLQLQTQSLNPKQR